MLCDVDEWERAVEAFTSVDAEQRHAPEPAAGPDSNGESSPPAR